jgi:hypothetical protein
LKRILFYLPNVTPWWFDHIVTPLIQALSAGHEVHVMVPPLWRGTGIEAPQLEKFLDRPEIAWHILDGENNPALRDGVAGQDEVIDLVRAINADYTLCRCADPDVIRLFPGNVKFIMEGVLPPFKTDSKTIIFTDQLFEYGAMPDLDPAELDRLDRGFAGSWELLGDYLARRATPDWRAGFGVARDRKVIAVPLEYEFEDTFAAPHRAFADNLAFVRETAAKVGDDIFLAFTNHPLNDLYVDMAPVEEAVAALGDCAAIVRFDDPAVNATEAVAMDCDGAILDLSKSYLVFAYFGVPMARPSSLRTAPWLNAGRDIATFADAVRTGAAQAPDPATTRRWFANHVANNAIHLRDHDLVADGLLNLLDRPSDPARWDRNLALYERILASRLDA